jgi:hypothetical protein
MKTNSSTAVRPQRLATIPEEVERPRAQPRRAPERASIAALPALGRRFSSRSLTQAAPARVPLERLHQFSASGERAAPRVTLADLMRADDASRAPAPVRQHAIPAAPASGPKIDSVHDPLMSVHRLGEAELSHLTEALGLGPAAQGQERTAQIKALGSVLRGPMDYQLTRPSSESIRELPFGRGLLPLQLKEFIESAKRVGCFISERQETSAQGDTVHLLQVHFAPALDRGERPLAADPESVDYRAVQQFAARFAEALLPVLRTDEKHYEVEFVACDRKQGGSADVFSDHLGTQIRLARPPARVRLFSEHVSDAKVRNSLLFAMLPPADREKLVRAMQVCHLDWDERVSHDDNGEPQLKLRVFFGGTENMRDVKNAFSSIGGGVGKVFKATHEAALLVAQAIDNAYSDNRQVKFDYISGGSMGGASAQLFAAGVQSRVQLHLPAPLVLFDPQLPNKAQLRHAVDGGKYDYDYAKPRGVAVTLDYAKKPRKSLMGRMKGIGFKSPGLVRLKLGLSDYDRTKKMPDKTTELRPPVTSGPPGMGYHADVGLYRMALRRFTGVLGLR